MSPRRIKAVLRKEMLHVLRDPRSLGMAIGIPMLMIVLFGYALTVDVDHVPIVVWDQSQTPQSRDLISRFTASRYFDFKGPASSYREIERLIDERAVYLGLTIPGDFAPRLAQGRAAPVQALIDGSDSNTAGIVLGYTQAITASYNSAVSLNQLQRMVGQTMVPTVDVRPRIWFNPDLESKNFIIPGIIAVIMGLIAALLTSLTVAREWERGTMEQLISTPIRPVELVIGKLIPYFAIGMLDVLISVLMAVFIFQVPLRGSVLLLFGTAAIFIVGTLAQGMVISIVARQQLLASQVAMISTFLPAFLLSGFMFAISNMPVPVQLLTRIIPARYFVSLVKGIYLRGVGLSTLWMDTLFLTAFGVIVLGLAIGSFKKRLG
ncbi:MAG TPA: ABC transporter permease [Opitutaceae bacterium]|nr:ABC transporter permease [Opitutaceae bacterium]